MSGEPLAWTQERKQRLAQQFPELGLAGSPNTLMGVDALKSSRGEAPSPFSQAVMRLGAASAQQVNPQ